MRLCLSLVVGLVAVGVGMVMLGGTDRPRTFSGAKTMAAVRSHGYSLAELAVEEIEVPPYGDHEVVIEVMASSINPVDNKMIEGYFWPMLTTPMVPGADFSGRVVAAGADCKRLSVGDDAFGFSLFLVAQTGSFVRYLVVPESLAAAKPRSMSHAEAAMIPVAGFTSEQVLRNTGVTKGTKILVLGASGGTGMFASLIASRAGAEVYATAGARNAELVTDTFGATHFVDYKAEHWWEKWAGENIDVVYDCVGERESPDRAEAVLSATGQFVTIASKDGQSMLGTLWANLPMMWKSLLSELSGGPSYRSVSIDQTGVVESGAAFAAFHADGMRWVTDATYVGLEAVGDALAHVNGGHVTGKVSLLFDWGQRTGTM